MLTRQQAREYRSEFDLSDAPMETLQQIHAQVQGRRNAIEPADNWDGMLSHDGSVLSIASATTYAGISQPRAVGIEYWRSQGLGEQCGHASGTRPLGVDRLSIAHDRLGAPGVNTDERQRLHNPGAVVPQACNEPTTHGDPWSEAEAICDRERGRHYDGHHAEDRQAGRVGHNVWPVDPDERPRQGPERGGDGRQRERPHRNIDSHHQTWQNTACTDSHAIRTRELQCNTAHTNANADSSVDHQFNSLLLDYLQLQTTQIEKFSGEPADFPRFKSTVSEHVLGKNLPESVKMARLLQFLSGKALLAVKDLVGIPGALRVAINRLQRRFGERYMVVGACLSSITAADPIVPSDKDKYQIYADRLISVFCTLNSMASVHTVTDDHMRKIVWNLPVRDQSKWIDKVGRGRPREPTFESLVEFVSERAQVLNDPVYTVRERFSRPTKVPEQKCYTKPKSFGINASREQDERAKPAQDNKSISHERDDRVRAAYLNTSASQANDKSASTHRQSPTVIATYQSPSVAGFSGNGGPGKSARAQTLMGNQSDRPSADNAPKDVYKVPCPVCGGPHRADRCADLLVLDVDGRRKIASSKRLCFNCLQTGHGAANCRSVYKCRITNCGRTHHTLLHTARKAPTEGSQPSSVEQATVHTVSACDDKPVVQILPLRVINNRGVEARVYGLLDSGSNTSFIERDLAGRLGLSGQHMDVSLTTLHGASTVSGERVSFRVGAPGASAPVFDVDHAVILPNLSVGRAKPMSSDRLQQWMHLKHLDIQQLADRQVRVIIGTNVPHAFVTVDCVYGGCDEPIGIKTPLGWTVVGPLKDGAGRDNPVFATNCDKAVDADLDNSVRQMFEIERFCLGGSKETFSVQDKNALQDMERMTCLVDGHYQVPMLWSRGCPDLPNNRAAAVVRLRHLKCRFIRDHEFYAKYAKMVDTYVSEGYAERLSYEDAQRTSKPMWYLPHHGVTNPNKPGKLRVVFDAAATYRGTCLNKQLVQGPSQTCNLIGVLLQFRQYRIALKADIEAMFHQVRVPPSDANCLRFLWWPGSLDEAPATYRMCRHVFGAKSSPCCTGYALKRVAIDNKDSFSESAVNAVLHNFYVDDFLASVPDETSAKGMLHDVRSLVAIGGFNLTKWSSNSAEVCADIPEGHSSLDPKAVVQTERALGILWDTKCDTLVFRSSLKEYPMTKRGVLAAIGSLFDPLGMIAPIILYPRIILQQLWQEALGWDDPMPEAYKSRWQTWLAQFSTVEDIPIPRCYDVQQRTDVQMHVFTDASEVGYGMVAYLRFTSSTDAGDVQVAFLFGKSRVAPLKSVSVPRMELQAALLGVRVATKLRQELQVDIQTVLFWTDSTTVLGYLRNTSKRFHTFVANRVAEIHENSAVEQWNHCPGHLNPADEASRGTTASQLDEGSRWFRGAAFLWRPQCEWPTDDQGIGIIKADDPEVRLEARSAATSASTERPTIETLCGRYSNYHRLKRACVWLLRFTDYINPNKTCRVGPITLQELRHVELRLIGAVQKTHFTDFSLLQQSQPVPRASALAAFNPFIDAGIVRVGGRLSLSAIPYDAKFPILIPRASDLARLLARWFHERGLHSGVEATLSAVRERFWVMGARKLVKSIIRQCIVCRKQNSQPQTQLMAPLPTVRTDANDPPFSKTGVDYFGPIEVAFGRKRIKRWGCIFTCMTTRACHLEVAPTLEADDFINTLRRFICRRGSVKTICSDNGTNFIGAQREIKRAITENNARVAESLQQQDIEWRLQPPTASHMSGVWERMIRSVKRTLNAVVGMRTVDDYRLWTLFAEVEYTLNSRPLTAVSDDPNDLTALTPNHFLNMRTAADMGLPVDGGLASRKRWHQVQYLAHQFWKRWSKEYLPTLQTRSKWRYPQRDIHAGDLVLICDENLPRNRWPLARVVEAELSADGHVRVVSVKTSRGTYRRPIHKLCVLEEDSRRLASVASPSEIAV